MKINVLMKVLSNFENLLDDHTWEVKTLNNERQLEIFGYGPSQLENGLHGQYALLQRFDLNGEFLTNVYYDDILSVPVLSSYASMNDWKYVWDQMSFTAETQLRQAKRGM